MWWYDSMGWWMLLGGLLMIVFWGGVIALIVWVIVRLTRRSESLPERRSALDIARERYARGEITKEQFEQLKRDLS